MKKIKKWNVKELTIALAIFACVMVIIGAITLYAAETNTTADGNYEYTVLNDGTVSITKYIGTATNVTVPEKIDGKTVSIIGARVFYGCSSLTSVIIPEGVTIIGGWAFYGCSNLTSIEIPDGVISVYDCAFYGCSSLTIIEIPSSVTSIGRIAFKNCSNLTSIIIPEGVTSIGVNAFEGCSSLTSIEIPEGVTSIESGIFSSCSSLKSIEIPEGVTSIGGYAFEGCSNLTSIIIPEGVTSIGPWAFAYCENLKEIEIPNSLTSIGESAFYVCSSLTSIEIPEGVTSIGNYAISGCSSLTSITIPQGVTSIGNFAFSSCSSLTSIIIPEGVTSIGNGAFAGCSNLTSIIIPEGVTSIGDRTFRGCSNLTYIIIPGKVTNIGTQAFRDCKSLTSINIPSGVTGIENTTFYGCSSLTNIEIPEGVTSIGSSAFCACSSLTSIKIPEGLTSIGKYAFSGCSSLKGIDIPEGVTSIGVNAFNGCSSLTSIEIPEGVTSIDDSSFFGCSSLTDIVLPETLTSIRNNAFYDCSSLKSIGIPSSVTSIDDFVFENIIKVYCRSNSYAKEYAIGKRLNYEIDDIAPSITSIKANVTGPTKAKSITYTFEFSENVKGFTKEDITVENGEIVDFNEKKVGSVHVFTVVVENMITGWQKISVGEGVCADYAGNRNKAVESQILIDYNAPQCIIKADKESPTNAESVTYTITFREWVKGFTKEDIKVENGKIIEDTFTEKKDGYAHVFTIKVTNNGTCKQTVSVGKGACTDYAGNSNLEGIKSISIDRTAPIIYIIPQTNDITNANKITYKIVCTEDVIGLETSDIQVSNGIISKFEKDKEKESRYIIEVTDIQERLGDVIIRIPEGVCKDIAGNENVESNQPVIEIDRTSVTCEITADQPSQTKAKSITYTFKFSESVTEFTKEDITVENGTKGTFSGSGDTYILVVENEETGWQEVSIAEGICENAQGSKNKASSKKLLIDFNLPKATIKADKEGPTNAESVTYTVTFLEWINDFTKEDITVENGNIEEFTGEKIGWAHVFTFVVTNSETGIQKVSIEKDVCEDYAGNANEASEPYIIQIDKTAPTIESVTGNPEEWTNQNVTLTINGAEDEHSGLANQPYSFDGGETWQAENTKTYEENAEGILIKVKDALGNIYTHDTINITKIHKTHTEVVDEAVVPTCTETGLEAGSHCSVCNEVLVAQEIIPAIGHTEVVDARVEPTCTETGLETGSHCSVCGDVLKAQQPILAIGHNYENGECTRCGEKAPEITVESEKYNIEEGILTQIAPQTTLETFIQEIETNATKVEIYSADNELVEEGKKIATGMKLKLESHGEEIEYTLAVLGDTNGDGEADFKDILQINKHRLNKAPLQGEYLKAGDVTENGEVDFSDILKVNKYRLGKINSL